MHERFDQQRQPSLSSHTPYLEHFLLWVRLHSGVLFLSLLDVFLIAFEASEGAKVVA